MIKPFVKQSDIARALGISRVAVGSILGNYSSSTRVKVSAETRRRVFAMAKRLGYRPCQHAQAIRKKSSSLIGIIQVSSLLQVHTLRVMHATHAIFDAGYQVLANDILWYNQDVTRACNAMLDARVEGLLLLTPNERFPLAELKRFLKMGIPVVSLSGVHFPGVPQVRADAQQGVYSLTRHLLELGYRKLSFLTCWSSEIHDEVHCWPVMERAAGFRQAIEERGGTVAECNEEKNISAAHQTDVSPGSSQGPITAEIVWNEEKVEWSDPYEGGRLAMKKLLLQSNRPEAVLCSDDQWALGALTACVELKIRVPEDIAVTGFDDEVFARHGYVPLTTVRQPSEVMAKKAVEMLLQLMRGKQLRGTEKLVKVPCQLMVRQSCGASIRCGNR